MLEGGYDLDALANSAATVLREMADLQGDPHRAHHFGWPRHGGRRALREFWDAKGCCDPSPGSSRSSTNSPRSPPASATPATGCTWWAARARPARRRRTTTIDYDFTTDARPDAIKKALKGWADAVWTQGEKFGTIGARLGDRTYEITTHRAEAYDEDSRKPDVQFSDEVEADLSRRDFTSTPWRSSSPPTRPTLVDPYGGAADLMTRTLRTPLSPEVSFSDDPLRMLRAARFIARFNATPAPSWSTRCATMHGRLSIVSAERVRDELDKLITLPSPTAGLWFAIDTGLADEFLPELPSMRLEQDPIHQHKDVLTHTLAVVENVRPPDEQPPDRPPFDFRRTRLAALFHDVGKPRTRGYQKGKGVTFHHHDAVGRG